MKSWTEEKLGAEAREALKRGIKRVASPVKITMGAKGRNVVYVEYAHAKPTNDGVSIARRIYPKDPYERIGADLIKEAAERTLEEAGDGTTCTVVVSEALVDEGEKFIAEGKSPMELRSELEAAKDEVVAALEDLAVDVKGHKDILNVAKVSVEDDEMAEIVTEAVEKAGKYGVVIVEEGSGYTIEKEEVKGYFWNRGYVSPYMITNEKDNTAVLEECPVIVTDRYMNLNKDLMQTLNELKMAGNTKALVIVDRCEGELLQSLIVNKVKGIFTTIVVSKPGTLEELEDIAAVTGAMAITKDKGIKLITAGHCGFAKKVVVEENKITIITDESPKIDARVKDLDEMLAKAKKDGKESETESLITRRAKLSDGIVMLRVGAKTEGERKYKKDKMDDAVAACKAAIEEGIVAGGGDALSTIASQLDQKTDGAKVMVRALRIPHEQILSNAGIKYDGNSYNVKTGKVVKDMIKEGIIDPAKVLRCAVENAVSFAGNFLTLEAVIADFQEEIEQQ